MRPSDAHVPGRAVAECVVQARGQPRAVDHHVADAGGGKVLQMPYDQRFDADLQQLLGRVRAHRAHALAFARGEAQCFLAAVLTLLRYRSPMAGSLSALSVAVAGSAQSRTGTKCASPVRSRG